MLAVSIESVTKTFGKRSALDFFGPPATSQPVRALDAVSLDVLSGEVFVLAGPNGSGKTTLLKIISTTLLPDCGRVLVGGLDAAVHPDDVRKKVGIAIASDRSFYPRLTACENLEFFAAFDDVPRAERSDRVAQVLAQADLSAANDTQVYKFSSGMCQKLGIARALLKRPQVLLLDEPSRSLDAGTTMHLWDRIRELKANGTAVLLATHNFEEAAAVGDRLGILVKGRLHHAGTIAGRAEELRASYMTVCASGAGEPQSEGSRALAIGTR
jgi:ABC-2 type transport system ATP-binding protein